MIPVPGTYQVLMLWTNNPGARKARCHKVLHQNSSKLSPKFHRQFTAPVDETEASNASSRIAFGVSALSALRTSARRRSGSDEWP